MGEKNRKYTKLCSTILICFGAFYLMILIYISIKFLAPEYTYLSSNNFTWIAILRILLTYVVFSSICFLFIYSGIGVLKLKKKARSIALWVTCINLLSLFSPNYKWQANVTRIILIIASLVVYYFLLKKPVKELFRAEGT